MTLEPTPGSRNPSARSTDALPKRWQQLLALSGFAFAVLLLLGWFLSAGNTPDYTATDEDWRTWAGEVGPRSGIGASLILFGGVAFLHFAATIRSTVGSAEPTVRGSGTLGSAAFGGALVGIAGIGMALVNVASATSAGATRIRSALERWQPRPPARTWLPRWALPPSWAPSDCRHCEAVPSPHVLDGRRRPR